MSEVTSGLDELLSNLIEASKVQPQVKKLKVKELNSIVKLLVSEQFADNRKTAQTEIEKILDEIVDRIYEEGK